MRIGLVRRGYSASGGAENYLFRLAAILRSSGHDPVLFCSQEWPDPVPDFAGEVHRLDGNSPLAFADALAAFQTSHPGTCDRTLSLERVHQCDVYRAGDGVHAAWLRRRRRYEPTYRSWLRGFNSKHRQILALEKSLFQDRRAGHVIANSRMVRDDLIAEYDYPPERIHLVHNGIPADALEPSGVSRSETRRRIGAAPDTFAILFLGSGWERKGLRYAVEAVHALPDHLGAELWIAGKGPAVRKPRVRMLGPVADPRPLLEAADLFILPTLYDPFSNASLEAAAAGLPVITTMSNGFSDVMEPGIHGSIIGNPADTDPLAAALLEWSAPDRRAAARSSLQDLARNFTIERNLAETLRVMEF